MDFFVVLLVLLSAWILVGLLVFWIGTSLPPRIDWAFVRVFGEQLAGGGESFPARLFGLCMALFSPKPRPGSLALVRRASRKVLPAGDSLKASLSALAHGIPPMEKTEPWEIVLLIDHSGSMGYGPGSALEDAKKAIVNMVHTLPKSFKLAVIEFDSEVRVVQPLNDNRRRLIASVSRIKAGGGTDIAKGLKGSEGQLPTDSEAAQAGRQALILLSDGDKDLVGNREEALEWAGKIKQRGVKLFTLELGDADEELLGKLASDGLHFHVQNASELKKLYQEIGILIVGGSLTGVEIEESLNVPIWRRRAFGGISPVFNRINGQMTWMLVSLGQETFWLDYELEPLCPGWHLIGASPAKLTGIQEDGQSYEGHSNRGPWVLVMPRIPGWQLWWLVLNPLYYLLLRNRQCRYAQTVGRVAPETATPKELARPSKLEDMEPPPRLAVEPTLVLGIGYAGIHVLTECKRLLWEVADEDSMGQLRFLAIDTAAEHYFPSPKVGTLVLQGSERLTLSTSLEPLITQESHSANPIYPWLPARKLAAGGARPDLQRGTGLQRALGRLAFLANLKAVETRLRTELEGLASLGKPKVRVALVGSTGGGSAGGILIDMSWLVRRCLNEMGYPNAAISLFLLPPFGQNQEGPLADDAQRQRQRNHAALMDELERVGTEDAYSPGEGFAEVRGLVDHVFLVGPSLPQREISVHRDLYPRGGETLFAWLTSEGLRRHFQNIPMGNSVYRLESASAYLYPHSLQELLCLEGLAVLLEQRLLGRIPSATGSVSAEPSNAAVGAIYESLQTRQLPQPGQVAETLPWLLLNLKYLPESSDVLKKRLGGGAGPLVSNGIDVLDIEYFMEDQDRLTEGLLRARISDAINDRSGEGGGLAITCCALQDLAARIDTVLEALAGFGTPANGQFGEADAVQFLATQTRYRVAAWIEHITGWEIFIGQGGGGASVLGRIRQRVSALRLAILNAREIASPKLTLDDSALDALGKRWLPDALENLLPRLWWKAELSTQSQMASKPKLILGIHKEKLLDVGLPVRPDAQIADGIIDDLLDILGHWTQGFKKLPIADYLPKDWTFSVSTTTGGGRFLVQGGAFPPNKHLPFQTLESEDKSTARLFAVEPLPLRQAWQTKDFVVESEAPYVLLEEFNAYSIYRAYLGRRGQVLGHLDPRVVALFRDPVKLRHFIASGLLTGAVVHEYRDGRPVWVDGSDVLAGTSTSPMVNFFAVAHGFLERPLALAEIGVPAFDRARLLAHPLLTSIDPSDPTMTNFVDMAEALFD